MLAAEAHSFSNNILDGLKMISVTCPEALMGLSAMVLYIMRSRDYPTSA